nr:hypothetical protein [Streptomyces sp. SID8382]
MPLPAVGVQGPAHRWVRRRRKDTGVGFIEHRLAHFCFARVAVAAALTVRDGRISEARIGLVNSADRPLRAHAAAEALIGAEADAVPDGRRLPDDHPFVRAGDTAAAQDAAPFAEPFADIDHKNRVIAVLVAGTLREAVADLRRRRGADQGEKR